MKCIIPFILSNHLNYFFFLFISLIIYSSCITDFDYHQKLRLNNGNYLIMSAQGIYLYNEDFSIKKNITIFKSRLLNSNNDVFKVDMAQFLTEDNGFIICLIRNETYILSNNATLLYHTTLNYIKNYNYYRIIPYGHLNNENYYVIITIEENNILIRKYIYDSLMNNLFQITSYKYSINSIHFDGISCLLMNYLKNKVITCFYNQENKLHYKVFNISNFEIIKGFEGEIPIKLSYQGAYLVSSVITNRREKAVCCSIYYGSLQCFGYNIKNNEFTSGDAITPSMNYCKDEFINLQLEYFPETDEFLFGCKGEGNYFYIGKYSSDFNFTNYGKIDIEIPSGCDSPNSFHFIYSSNVEKYSLLADMGECVNERIINLNSINISSHILIFGHMNMNKTKCIYNYFYDINNIYQCTENNSCPSEFPFLNEEKQCIKNCTIINLFNKACFINNDDNKIKDEIINNIKNAITSHSIDTILDKIILENNDIIISEKNIKYQITTSLNQNTKEYNNISTINFGECENILKYKYNISINDSLLIFKIDTFYEGYLTPIVLYEIYNPKTKEKLDLNYCKNNLVKIVLPVNINEKELYKYNPSNEFYKDICIAYTTENGTDITLNDRKNEFIDKNLSLCENDNSCNYSTYDYKTKKIICDCYIKINLPFISEILIDKVRLLNSFDIKNIINLNVMKCYKIVFSKEGLINNPGNYIILAIIVIYIILYPLVFITEIYNIFHTIVEIINLKKNNYDKKATKIKKIDIYSKKDKDIQINKKEGNKVKRRNINKIAKNIIRKMMDVNFPPKKKRKASTIKNISSHSPVDSGKIKSISEYKSTNEKSKNDLLSVENNIEQKKKPKKRIYDDYELNDMPYFKALIYDKRTYFQYYISLLKIKHIFIYIIFPLHNDPNSKIIKGCLFLFTFALYFTVNGLFFDDSTIHEIYIQKGEFNFIYHFPQKIYSIIIASIVNILIKYFSLSSNDIMRLKNTKIKERFYYKAKNIFKCIKIKFNLFFIISFLFLIFFWYYLSCLCAIYRNSKIIIIKDTLIGFAFSLIYPFIIYLIPGIFRIYSLKKKTKNKMYKFSRVIQLL